jgi:hypothetical protein
MPLKMKPETVEALKKLLAEHSTPRKFQPKGQSLDPAASVYEMFADYKKAGKEGMRFRWDLLYSVPTPLRQAWFDGHGVYSREGQGLDDDHIDSALRQIMTELFTVKVPAGWGEDYEGLEAKVVGWQECEGDRMVTLQVADGRKVMGDEQELETQFTHELPPAAPVGGMKP